MEKLLPGGGRKDCFLLKANFLPSLQQMQLPASASECLNPTHID